MNANEETYLDLMHELEAERDWRIAELSKIKLLFREIKEMNINEYTSVYLKMTVPMVYAHWEGYCVASFKIIMDYINRKEMNAQLVAYNILTYANNKTYDKLKGKSSFTQRVEFSKEFIEILNGNIRIVGKLDTKSNLNYKVLQEIIKIFRMNEEGLEQYESELNLLVNIRNAIAHGENSRMINFDKMNANIELVTNLIDIMLLKEVQYIQNESYLLD
ncbi:hypothetical protein GPL15_09080 [Clostridium sp. MCC353]|uniref:MAE_28990/MAE_18760 family HEPN-like nuclease n=1 Tax=Clostridium sp. MCC353 TaxID=2592646 RepID=UPI001C018AD8|nr:MAE_28990/MAE_18760 family HEPN-like nuclease [Clostridium sp. MCC353]MBT9776656.1 hypothetical protein [Clostridium sp. MCC353]